MVPCMHPPQNLPSLAQPHTHTTRCTDNKQVAQTYVGPLIFGGITFEPRVSAVYGGCTCLWSSAFRVSASRCCMCRFVLPAIVKLLRCALVETPLVDATVCGGPCDRQRLKLIRETRSRCGPLEPPPNGTTRWSWPISVEYRGHVPT